MRRAPACAARAARTCGRSGSRASSSTPSTSCGVRAPGWSRRPAGSIGSWTGIGRSVSDSGGFQVWSLIRQDPDRGVIRDNEVIFREPSTGEKWNLTPERIVEPPVPARAATSSSASTTAPMRTPPRPSRSAPSSGRSAGRAAAARSSIAQVAAARRRSRRASSPSSRAAAIEALRRQCAAALAEIGFDGYGFGGWPLAARRHAARRADALGRRVAAARGAEARARDRPPRPRRQRLRARLLDLRLRAADPRRAPRPALRVPRRLVLTPAGARRRLLPRGPHPRSAVPGRRTDRSRTAATARSARATRRPTCTTCSRSATRSAERLATLHNLRFYVRLFALLRS